MSALDTTSFNSPLGYNSPSFGTIPQQDFGKAIALQSDGKIVAVGTISNGFWALARYIGIDNTPPIITGVVLV